MHVGGIPSYQLIWIYLAGYFNICSRVQQVLGLSSAFAKTTLALALALCVLSWLN